MQNRYPGRCHDCDLPVPPHAGTVSKVNGRWLTYCSSCGGGAAATQAATGRRITADGEIIMGYDPAAIPLLRAMPGARWNPDSKTWRVSLAPADRPRVLELARRLDLEIDPSLLDTPADAVADAAEARARAAGLYPYQISGVRFLAAQDRAILADEMGLGKTAQTLLSLADNAATLVICPASLKYNWRSEAAKWRPDLAVSILADRKEFRVPYPNEILVTNYEALPEQLQTDGANPQAWSGVTLVLDEAHKIKANKAQRSLRCRALAKVCAKVVALTGTPLLGKPLDLWGVLSNADCARKIFSWPTFLKLFRGSKGRYGYEFGAPDPAVPEILRRAMLRRLRAEVLPDLPRKTYQTLLCNGTDRRTIATLDALLEEYREVLDAGALPPFSALSKIRATLAGSRVAVAQEIIEAAEDGGTPLLVFSAHKDPVTILGSREGWKAITGDTPPLERQEITDAFQRGELRGVALTIAAGGVGLTLTRASTVLFLDLDWTPALNSQAEDRVCRIGQTATAVQIIRLVTDHPLDLRVCEILTEKAALIDQAIEREYHYTRGDSPLWLPSLERAAEEAACQYAGIVIARKVAAAALEVQPIPAPLGDSIRQAWGDMLSRCDGARERDGAGFNKPDAALAHTIRPALDNDAGLTLALHTLRKYRRQLVGTYPEIFA